ncbi:MORN repeat protein [Seminavis robusta]|uniref:MORN repeat protein n=1 Tax=Seminavis robusta TaxID=568900 RepID=A0A9N8HHH0_9STRA|nr:MORN repeat protein [Seminavis robusta]|eukprot:Sro448_g145050.1 MORN repeat protein (864) ;mRNA; f:3921-6621
MVDIAEDMPMGSWAPLPNEADSKPTPAVNPAEQEPSNAEATDTPDDEAANNPPPSPAIVSEGKEDEDDANTVSTEEESATAPEADEEAKESEHGDEDKTKNADSAAAAVGQVQESVVERKQVTLMDHKGRQGVYTGRVILIQKIQDNTIPDNDNDNDNDKQELMMPDGHGTMEYKVDSNTDNASNNNNNQPTSPVATYTGHWQRGAWHGQGQATMVNGDTYAGEHQHGTRHGSGTYQWKDGRTYAGSFCRDNRHGQGTYTWPCGAVYSGEYHHGVRQGYGKYLEPTEGISFMGDWKQGSYHGYGVLTSTILTEDEKDNQTNKGISTDLPKRIYRGNFVKGQAHGHGVEVNPDGTIRHDGEWKNGTPLDRNGNPLPDSEEEEEEPPKQPELLVVQNQVNVRDANGLQGTYRGILHVATGLPHGSGTLTYGKYQKSPHQDDLLEEYEGCFDMGQYHGRGRLRWKNGDGYDGEYVQGKRHGQGTYKWHDGRHYKGEFQDDMRHGFGKFVYGQNQNADWYEGSFVKGRREGQGRFVFSDGAVYDGGWKEGLYHGQGTLISAAKNSKNKAGGKTTYTGGFERGLAHGQGKETAPDGTVVYEGNWINGDPEPEAKRKAAKLEAQEQQYQAVMGRPSDQESTSSRGGPRQPECEAVVDREVVDAEGNTGQYTGLVLFGTNKPHGVGRMVYLDGRRIHEGFWKNGMKDGHGRCLFVEQGDFHEGEYKNNVRHGPGTYKWADGRVFKGHYRNDLRNGHGIFSYPHGERYEGNFTNGEKDGHGRIEFPGGYYEGSWEQGRWHGRGVLSKPDGVREGIFRDGDYVGKAICDVHHAADDKDTKTQDDDVDSVDLNDGPSGDADPVEPKAECPEKS